MRLSLLIVAAAAAAGCSTQEIVIPHQVPLLAAEAPYVGSARLDVGVIVFNSGVPDEELDRQTVEELMRDGTFISIRRAEAILNAVELRDTLERSGHWGSVWVTPSASTAVDVNLHTEILQSDGHALELRVRAEDVTGRVWFRDRYEMETAGVAYRNRQRYGNLDPYQDVFNEIANDLAEARAALGEEEAARIRTIGELRYAGELMPEAFGDYLEQDKGVYELVRLPAAGDPNLARTQAVRQRAQLVFETLGLYYDEFTLEAEDPYFGWRDGTRGESIMIKEAARAAKLRTGLGALMIATTIMSGRQSSRNSLADVIVQDAGMYIGFDLIRSGQVRRQERRLHLDSLQELSESFEDNMKPLVVEIRGTQHRLTGTAAARYEEFQRLLQDEFRRETGFVPDDIDIYIEPDADAEGEATAEPAATAAEPAPTTESAAGTSAGAASEETATDDSGVTAQGA